jgi:hypothetical protein
LLSEQTPFHKLTDPFLVRNYGNGEFYEVRRDQGTEYRAPEGQWYQDGFGGIGRYVLNFLFTDLARRDPEIAKLARDGAYTQRGLAGIYGQWPLYDYAKLERFGKPMGFLEFESFQLGHSPRHRVYCKAMEARMREDLVGTNEEKPAKKVAVHE